MKELDTERYCYHCSGNNHDRCQPDKGWDHKAGDFVGKCSCDCRVPLTPTEIWRLRRLLEV